MNLNKRDSYWPDLAPFDYKVFLQLKKSLIGSRFILNEEAIEVVEAFFLKGLEMF